MTSVADEAFASMATCIAGSDHLLAAIVVDESGSLQSTDSEHRRVGAVKAAVTALQQLHESSDGDLEVQATLATFGQFYDTLIGWGSVEGSHVTALHGAIDRTLPSRNSAQFTDFKEALVSARASLNQREASLTGTSCKILFWFTDGKLDLDDQGGDKPVTIEAREAICKPGGVADQIRRDHIGIIGLALFTSSGSGSVTDADRDNFRSIVEGSANGVECGQVPIPRDWSAGAYLNADNPNALKRMFSQATARIGGATPGTSVRCPDSKCVNGELDIPVDRGIGGMHMVLERLGGSAPPLLTSPRGEVITLEEGGAVVDGAAVEITDSAGLLSVTVDFETPSAGVWILRTADTFDVDVYYRWGVSLEVAAASPLFVGESNRVEIRAIDRWGHSIVTSDLSDLQFEARINGDTVPAGAFTNGAWSIPVVVHESTVALGVDATLRAATVTHGIQLGPVTVRKDLPTRLPPSFPGVSPTRLSLPEIEGLETSTGRLTLTGSDEGETRACVTGVLISEQPEPVEAIRAEHPECVEVPQAGEAQLELQISPSRAADGLISGELELKLFEANGAETHVVRVPFDVLQSRPANVAVLWFWAAILLVGALLGAWAAAELIRRRFERFHIGVDTRVASVPVVATEAGLARADGKEPLLDPARDFEAVGLALHGRHASFVVAGLTFGRSFNPFNPLSESRPYVEAPGAIVVVPGGTSLTLTEDGSRAPVRFPGTVDFIFVADPETVATETGIQGRLVMLVDSPHGVAAVLEDRLQQVVDAPWDRLLEAVRAAAASRSPASNAGEKSTPTAAQARPLGESPSSAFDRSDSDVPPPPPLESWGRNESVPQLPEASVQKERKSGPSIFKKRQAKSTRRKDEVNPDPPPRSEEPPPSMNFWD